MNLRELHRWLYVQLDNLPRSAWFALLDSPDRAVRVLASSPLTASDPAAALVAIIAVTPRAYSTIFLLGVHALARVCAAPISADTRARAEAVAGLLESESRDRRAAKLLCALEGAPPIRRATPYRTRFGGLHPRLPSCFSAENLVPREHMFYFVLCRLVWLQAEPWEVPRDDPRVINVVRSYAEAMNGDPLEDIDAARRAFFAPFKRLSVAEPPVIVLQRVSALAV